MGSFLIYTLGCKVNQYESEYVREGLERLGYQEAKPGENVDICIINTCTVTAESDLKSRKIIRRCARQHPKARIVVMGCYATRAPQELAHLPGVVELIEDKANLPRWFAQLGLADPPKGISAFGCRHRAFVKVQDGCRQGCRYCIIPLVRPVLRSRRLPEVLEEIKRLVEGGYREIVLTGIHLGHYGLDLPAPQPSLVDLIGKTLELPGLFRVRLSSLEAVEVKPELVQLMAARPERFCPHFHLPLQSGSNRLLERMGRPYRLQDFLAVCEQIRARLDNPALTTDVLLGFPGETDDDFQVTCQAVEQVGFSKIHIFPFSPRPGTAAAQMLDRPSVRVVRRRCAQMREIAHRLRRRYMETLLGRSVQVLVEEQLGPCRQLLPEQISTCPLEGGLVPSGHLGSETSLPISFSRDRHSLQEERGGPVRNTLPSEELRQGESEKALCLLRGTSEQYVPVYFAGPPTCIGQLITLQAKAILEDKEGHLAVWAEWVSERRPAAGPR